MTSDALAPPDVRHRPLEPTASGRRARRRRRRAFGSASAASEPRSSPTSSRRGATAPTARVAGRDQPLAALARPSIHSGTAETRASGGPRPAGPASSRAGAPRLAAPGSGEREPGDLRGLDSGNGKPEPRGRRARAGRGARRAGTGARRRRVASRTPRPPSEALVVGGDDRLGRIDQPAPASTAPLIAGRAHGCTCGRAPAR